jgi:hypothetical protein
MRAVHCIYDTCNDLMVRCAHLYVSGEQCEREAFPGIDFCEDHADLHRVEDQLEESPFKKAVIRLAALILLVMFLIPLYYTLRTLYLGVGVEIEAEEGR